jgi:uncharacterized membrane protein
MATNSESLSSAAIDEAVVIRRPVEEVFSFYTDFRNLPTFLGDVMSVELIGPTTSHWTVQGPLGIKVTWTVEVTEKRINELIFYETVSSSLKTQWEIYFTRRPDPRETQVREVMKTPLGGAGRAVLALVGKPPAEEVAANLQRLKELLETGRVTDESHAVAGKFNRHR